MANVAADNAAGPAAGAPAAPGPAAPAPSPIRPLNFEITVPDLRNGTPADIQQAAPKSSMSAFYHWPVITALPNDQYIPAVEYFIRASYAQMLHVTGGNPTAVQQTDMRRRAIVLGSIRAGAVAAYRLTAADITPAEVVTSGMEYVPGGIRQNVAGTTSAGRWAAANSMAQLEALEHSIVGILVYLGMAVPVLQGVSLVGTGHHYIPPTYNLFAGIKRQALGAASPETRAWIETMGQDFDDVAFHKACHPVAPNLKRALSKKLEVAQRLRASGHGSAAIRLPAVPSEASGGKAALALLRSASATIQEMGHTISYDKGIVLMSDLEHAASGNAEAEACDAVITWVAENASTLAFCAGIVQQVHEVSGVGKNTILAAYSIKRLMSDNPAQVSQGVAYARAAAAKMRRSLEDGTYADPQFTL